jgi:hypothetical protein
MKLVVIFVGLVLLSACASSPQLIRVKNCKDLGAGLFDCEKLTPKEVRNNDGLNKADHGGLK